LAAVGFSLSAQTLTQTREDWHEWIGKIVPGAALEEYGDVAAAIDRPIPLLPPCHRIIGANRELTGFRGGLEMKRRLLDIEQIKM